MRFKLQPRHVSIVFIHYGTNKPLD